VNAGGAGEVGFANPRPTLFEKCSYRRFKFEMLVIIRRNDLPGLDLALEVAGKEPSLRMSRRVGEKAGQWQAPPSGPPTVDMRERGYRRMSRPLSRRLCASQMPCTRSGASSKAGGTCSAR
jgi:hypothetical protein